MSSSAQGLTMLMRASGMCLLSEECTISSRRHIKCVSRKHRELHVACAWQTDALPFSTGRNAQPILLLRRL